MHVFVTLLILIELFFAPEISSLSFMSEDESEGPPSLPPAQKIRLFDDQNNHGPSKFSFKLLKMSLTVCSCAQLR
jgi:hypothetical protein